MSPYAVGWTDDALDELASLWLQAPNPLAVTQAQTQIDTLLRQAPLQHGSELSEGLRELIVPPLRVLYSVEDGRRAVEVSSVKVAP